MAKTAWTRLEGKAIEFRVSIQHVVSRQQTAQILVAFQGAAGRARLSCRIHAVWAALRIDSTRAARPRSTPDLERRKRDSTPARAVFAEFAALSPSHGAKGGALEEQRRQKWTIAVDWQTTVSKSVRRLASRHAQIALATARPTSSVPALPPRSGVRGAPLCGFRTFSMATSTASWASR